MLFRFRVYIERQGAWAFFDLVKSICCSTFSTGRLRSQLSCKLSWAMIHSVWSYNDHLYRKSLGLVDLHLFLVACTLSAPQYDTHSLTKEDPSFKLNFCHFAVVSGHVKINYLVNGLIFKPWRGKMKFWLGPTLVVFNAKC